MNMTDDLVRNTQERANLGAQRECDFCGEMLWYVEHGDYLQEQLWPPDELGEFYDPDGDEHKIGHAECGIDWGWEIA